MTELLRRNLAPINETAWAAIDEQAKATLTGCLSARKTIDVAGPYGWEKAALNLGTVKVMSNGKAGEANWGVRELLPLVEVRVPFKLNQFDIDNMVRGMTTPDLDPLVVAARKIATFEENLIYKGLKGAGVEGMFKDCANKPVELGKTPKSVLGGLQKALLALKANGVGGPYQLVLGTEGYARLGIANTDSDYPLRKRLLTMLQGGDIIWSPALEIGALIARRGGDFELTIGKDLSIGYSAHGDGKVELYLTESLTYRTLEPKAMVALI